MVGEKLSLFREMVGSAEVTQDFAKTLKRLSTGSERLIITNRNKPVAILLSVEHYERLEAGQETGSELEQDEAGHGSQRWGG